MNPLTYKVYRRVAGKDDGKYKYLAAFRFRDDADIYMDDKFRSIKYQHAVPGTRVIVKYAGRIIAKREY